MSCSASPAGAGGAAGAAGLAGAAGAGVALAGAGAAFAGDAVWPNAFAGSTFDPATAPGCTRTCDVAGLRPAGLTALSPPGPNSVLAEATAFSVAARVFWMLWRYATAPRATTRVSTTSNHRLMRLRDCRDERELWDATLR